jgi:hypothetical protein
MRAALDIGSHREPNVDIAVDGERIFCKWTVDEAKLEATLVVAVGGAYIQAACVNIFATGAPTLRLRPLCGTRAAPDNELSAKMRKQWISAVKENAGLKLHCTVDATSKRDVKAILADAFASLPKASAPLPLKKRTAPPGAGHEATPAQREGDGAAERSPKRARGGRSRDGTLALPPPPETPKAEFVPVKPLTQNEMAVIGLGEIWEKTQREATALQERSPEMDSIYEELGFQKKDLFW